MWLIWSRFWWVLKNIPIIQWENARNLEEPWKLRLLRFFWTFVYCCKAFRVGWNSLWRVQLGSHVLYQGREWCISNWAGHDYSSLVYWGQDPAEHEYDRNVSRERFTPVLDLKEFSHRFTSGVEFYVTSWLSIDVNRRLYPEHFSR